LRTLALDAAQHVSGAPLSRGRFNDGASGGPGSAPHRCRAASRPGEDDCHTSSFRGAARAASPESFSVLRDSGSALRAVRNDEVEALRFDAFFLPEHLPDGKIQPALTIIR
jgi:hypothetical protein